MFAFLLLHLIAQYVQYPCVCPTVNEGHLSIGKRVGNGVAFTWAHTRAKEGWVDCMYYYPKKVGENRVEKTKKRPQANKYKQRARV